MAVKVLKESDFKNPKLREEGEKNYVLRVHDAESSIYNLLDCIKSVANAGHSFEVVVDPGAEDEFRFYIDGDGTDHISEIKIQEYEGE